MARLVAFQFLLVLIGAGIFSRCAAQEEGGGLPDSLVVSHDRWYEATHPSVEFKLSREKDVTNWDARIVLAQPFGKRFNVRLNASLHSRSNSTLKRADANDGTTASLSYDLNDDLSFSINYNSSVLANWYDLSGGAPDDRKKRGSFTVATDLAKEFIGGMGVNVHIGGGATQNSYTNLTNSGNQGDIGVSMTYNPPGSNFQASAGYTGKHIFLTSQVADSTGAVSLETEDKTFSQNLTFNVGFDMFPGMRVAANIRANDEQKQRPDQIADEQETELRKRRAVSMTSTYRLSDRFTWDASVNLSRAKSRFAVRHDRNSDINNAKMKGSMKIIPWAGSTLSLGGSWEVIRSVYVTPDTGNNIKKSASMKYSQKLGPKADISFSALSDLTVIAYDDKKVNPKDRDLLTNRYRLDFAYKLRPRITLSLGAELSDETSVYTQSRQSGNNKDTDRYRLTGSYDIKTWKRVALNQRYEISSVFTDYHYDEPRSTLVRNSNINTTVDVKIVRDLGINVRHNYKYQDQGSYRREGGERLYGRAAASESHLLSISTSRSGRASSTTPAGRTRTV